MFQLIVESRQKSKEMTTSMVESDALEIRVHWGDLLLEVFELSPPRTFYVGEGSREEGVDFSVPDSIGMRLPLVIVESGMVYLQPPAGCPVYSRHTGTPFADAPLALQSGRVALGANPVDVEIGALTFSIRAGSREARCPRAFGGEDDGRALGFFAASALLGAAFSGMMAYFTPPLALTDDEDASRDQAYLMSVYLDATAEREREREQTPDADGQTAGGPNAPAEAAVGEVGKMGRRDETATHRRASGIDPSRPLAPAVSRVEALKMATEFGMIGILSQGAAASAVAPWDDAGGGNVAAAGDFFGTEIGDVAGMGGLAPSGTGEGGGGRAHQIGLGSIGTCDGENCAGFGRGIGRGRGPGHDTRVPRLRSFNTIVSGHLPAEVVQRVVRQNFGRFRACYEDGLRTNPNLEGRVTARFVISRDGSVGAVQSGGSDLPDAHVVSCVLHTYSSLSFPSPGDGVVTVTYPLSFSPAA